MKKIIFILLIGLHIVVLQGCSAAKTTENTETLSYTQDELIMMYINRILTESTPSSPIWNVESANWSTPKWNYIDGCMMTALLDLYDQTNDIKYLNFADNFMDYYVYQDGSLRGYKLSDYNIDNINEGRVLFDLYNITGKQKYRLGIDTIYNQILNHPRITDGNFWHKQIYPNQVWLDGLYMAQPFYTRYESIYNDKANYSDIINQFTSVREKMYSEEHQLYYHGYDDTKSIFWADSVTGLSDNFWLRSIGWYTIALVDVYSYLDVNSTAERIIIANLLEEILEGIYLYKDQQTNMFYQIPNLPNENGNYLETSGSAMISYASLKASRLGIVDEKYADLGLEVFDGICQKHLRYVNGKMELGGICLSAGLGPENRLTRNGSVAYYLSEPVVKNDAKGVAPFLMAYTEILRLR